MVPADAITSGSPAPALMSSMKRSRICSADSSPGEVYAYSRSPITIRPSASSRVNRRFSSASLFGSLSRGRSGTVTATDPWAIPEPCVATAGRGSTPSEANRPGAARTDWFARGAETWTLPSGSVRRT